jgi:hypothetical protein
MDKDYRNRLRLKELWVREQFRAGSSAPEFGRSGVKSAGALTFPMNAPPHQDSFMDCVIAQMLLEALKECLFQVREGLSGTTKQVFNHRATKMLRVFGGHLKIGYLSTDCCHDVRLLRIGIIVEPSQVFRLSYHFQ